MQALTRKRAVLPGLLILAAAAIKLIEDIVTGESGPVDQAVLWSVREFVPPVFTGFFVTFSRSAAFMIPLCAAAMAALLAVRRVADALPLTGALAAVCIGGLITLLPNLLFDMSATPAYGSSNTPKNGSGSGC